MSVCAPTAAGEPLDLHEGIALKPAGGCGRWPEALRLLASDGTLARGRCRATNLCSYCRALYVIETVEALTLDALGGEAPTVWAVATAREHLTRPEWNEHLRMVRQRMKREGWRVEWFVQVEYQRRGALHGNLLVKGVPAGDAERWHARFVELWCARVDALPVGQWCEAIDDPYAVSRYVAKLLAHGLKSDQAPPIGWKGHRTSHTRGYFGRPMWKVRAEAAASLASKRALWRAIEEGYAGEEAEVVAEAQLVADAGRTWECVVVVDKAKRPAGGVLVTGTEVGPKLDRREPWWRYVGGTETGEVVPRYRGLRGGDPVVRRRPHRRRLDVDQVVESARRALDEEAAAPPAAGRADDGHRRAPSLRMAGVRWARE